MTEETTRLTKTDDLSPTITSSSDNVKMDVLPRVMETTRTCGRKEVSSNPNGTRMTGYVYAIGKVVHRFPTKSLEMELAQATGRRVGKKQRVLPIQRSYSNSIRTS